jgi:hypothetical protein
MLYTDKIQWMSSNVQRMVQFRILFFWDMMLKWSRVTCWPLVPKFAGSNPTEAVGFLRAKKSSARLPSEGK